MAEERARPGGHRVGEPAQYFGEHHYGRRTCLLEGKTERPSTPRTPEPRPCLALKSSAGQHGGTSFFLDVPESDPKAGPTLGAVAGFRDGAVFARVTPAASPIWYSDILAPRKPSAAPLTRGPTDLLGAARVALFPRGKRTMEERFMDAAHPIRTPFDRSSGSSPFINQISAGSAFAASPHGSFFWSFFFA